MRCERDDTLEPHRDTECFTGRTRGDIGHHCDPWFRGPHRHYGLRRKLLRRALRVQLLGNLTFIGGTILFALAGHLLEIALWAFVLDLCDGVADFSAALYCSAGNYTTVGSG